MIITSHSLSPVYKVPYRIELQNFLDTSLTANKVHYKISALRDKQRRILRIVKHFGKTLQRVHPEDYNCNVCRNV